MTGPEHETDVDAAREATSGLVRKVLIGTVLAVLVFAALSLYADVNALYDNLEAFRWSAFGVALALSTGNYLLRYLRWQYLLRRIGVDVPHGESALVFLSGFVMSVTPGKLGEVFKSLLLYESRGISIAKTAPVVFAERLTDLIALVILVALGSLSFEQGMPVAAAGGALAGVLVLASAWRRFGQLLIRIASKLPLLKRIAPRLEEAYASLRVMVRPVPMVVTTLLGTVSWGLECVALWWLLEALPGGGLGFDGATFAYSASTLVGAVAMMPGGLGVTEAGMTGLIQALSGGAIGKAAATAATMFCRLATLWWAVVIGAVALGVLRRRLRRQ